jgi:Ni,Fe-hydrogenase III small subunit/NAD-dependent dihydropyrimidine dehydrogenase PreA subunit
MLQILAERMRQGHRTTSFPKGLPQLPDRFRGLPILDQTKCPDGCQVCAEACPTDAILGDLRSLRIDMGRCLFCTDCVAACPAGAITQSQDYRLATRSRDALITDGRALGLAQALDQKMRQLFGRSLKLRQVSAGGCNGCEADVNVLSTIAFDLGRFGIQFVASPRHADGLLITGPVTENMKFALEQTYEATPAPKIVIAVGACAISGGPYIDHDQVHNGAESVVPVDLYIPGCPPHPLTILDGLLRLLGRIEDDSSSPSRMNRTVSPTRS